MADQSVAQTFRCPHPPLQINATGVCCDCGAAVLPCMWTSASECFMARERSVAGISDAIPTCAEHTDDPEWRS